ncbi:MAG: hypothetical protein KGI25_02880 [Thaumarchaeota archaeon]|nr:hypothetical protein [Nitrososphaerota archaeon]
MEKYIEFHPSQIPISKTFEVNDDLKAPEIALEMVRLVFASQRGGFRVLMTKEKNTAKKIGFTIMNELNLGLRKAKQERDVRYWIYNYDQDHFAMVLIGSKVLESLGF